MFSKIKNIIKEYRELKYLAYHDSLTGLLNRNWLYKNINSISISKKYVYFIDLNGLHKINKRGHTFGDEHINNTIKSIKLSSDEILVRYAGDEFILFSNRLNALITNEIMSVGFSEIKGDILNSINIADGEMLKSKQLYFTKAIKNKFMKKQAVKLEITNSRNDEKRIEWFFCNTDAEKDKWIKAKKKDEDEWKKSMPFFFFDAVSIRDYYFTEYKTEQLLECNMAEFEGMQLKDFLMVIKNCQ